MTTNTTGGNMLTLQTPGAAEAEDRSRAQKIAEDFFPKVLPDIASMSKEEMAMLLHGLACKLMVVESGWERRKSYVKADFHPSNPCKSVLKLYYALDDYAYLTAFEDIRLHLEAATARNAELGGSVYIAEFSDGHIKIGHSISPDRRLRDIAGGNQSKMLRHWIGPRVKSAVTLEHRAHRHFAAQRAGGEFFKVDFNEAVAWVVGELRGESKAC